MQKLVQQSYPLSLFMQKAGLERLDLPQLMKINLPQSVFDSMTLMAMNIGLEGMDLVSVNVVNAEEEVIMLQLVEEVSSLNCQDLL